MSGVDLAMEMAAARARRAKQTAGLLREARVQAIRGAVRPGSTRTEVEERARSFYPRLSEELLQEAVSIVSGEPPPPPAPEPEVEPESEAAAVAEAAEAPEVAAEAERVESPAA
jgi:hypothetical protein